MCVKLLFCDGGHSPSHTVSAVISLSADGLSWLYGTPCMFADLLKESTDDTAIPNENKPRTSQVAEYIAFCIALKVASKYRHAIIYTDSNNCCHMINYIRSTGRKVPPPKRYTYPDVYQFIYRMLNEASGQIEVIHVKAHHPKYKLGLNEYIDERFIKHFDEFCRLVRESFRRLYPVYDLNLRREIVEMAISDNLMKTHVGFIGNYLTDYMTNMPIPEDGLWIYGNSAGIEQTISVDRMNLPMYTRALPASDLL